MVICVCGNEAKFKTSWTDRNLGRRFYDCWMKAMDCGFLGLVDPPMCERDLDVFPGLLRDRNVLEEDLEDNMLMLREKERMIRKLRKYLMLACVMVFVAFNNKLVEYNLNNIGLDGPDGEAVGWVEEDVSFRCSSSTPLKTRQKKEGNVNEDEEVLRYKGLRTKQKWYEVALAANHWSGGWPIKGRHVAFDSCQFVGSEASRSGGYVKRLKCPSLWAIKADPDPDADAAFIRKIR
ncbi:zinc finger, GRF-type containing protein [Tanacetum coccineum]